MTQYTVGPDVLISSKTKVFRIDWKCTYWKRNICMTVFFSQNRNIFFRFWVINIWKWPKSLFQYFPLKTVPEWWLNFRTQIMPRGMMALICIPKNTNQIGLVYIYIHTKNLSWLFITMIWETLAKKRNQFVKNMSILIG